MLRRDVGSEIEFTTITRFESVQAIKQFAGEDYEAVMWRLVRGNCLLGLSRGACILSW